MAGHLRMLAPMNNEVLAIVSAAAGQPSVSVDAAPVEAGRAIGGSYRLIEIPVSNCLRSSRRPRRFRPADIPASLDVTGERALFAATGRTRNGRVILRREYHAHARRVAVQVPRPRVADLRACALSPARASATASAGRDHRRRVLCRSRHDRAVGGRHQDEHSGGRGDPAVGPPRRDFYDADSSAPARGGNRASASDEMSCSIG